MKVYLDWVNVVVTDWVTRFRIIHLSFRNTVFKRSHSQVFCKIVAVKDFAKFRCKHSSIPKAPSSMFAEAQDTPLLGLDHYLSTTIL